MKSSVLIFDKPYSAEKIAEGKAVQWAVFSGSCNKCKNLKQCVSDRHFTFPQNAPCMVKKAELLKGGAE